MRRQRVVNKHLSLVFASTNGVRIAAKIAVESAFASTGSKNTIALNAEAKGS
jgi:hypothetical protein